MHDQTPWSARMRAYVLAVGAFGVLALAAAGFDFAVGRIDPLWLGLACLTVLSASVTIKLPALPARISISDTFVFTSLLVFGVSAATLTVALDGFVASLWAFRGRPHRAQKTLFNTTAPALALWAPATLCFGLADLKPAVQMPAPVQDLLAPLFVAAALYFALNSALMATAIGFETGSSPRTIWSENFLWIAVTYLGSASVSVLLVLLFNTPAYGPSMFGIIVPLLALFYLALRFVTARAEDEIAHLKALKAAAEERSRLEEQLRDAHKMESVGRLAAGVAHDFNNLLAPILGYTEMLLEDLPQGSPLRDEVSQIRVAAERARDLTRQLLAFGRRQLLSLTAIDLRSVLAGFERLIRRTLRENIDIVVSCPETPCPVRADAGQIEQVLMNLALNAQDAMPDGGRLTFTIAERRVGTADPLSASLVPGPYVALTVSDTGVGMDAETLALVCEPFFTTKERGKGTGLGLSMVFGIAKQHGGHLHIESAEGRGTSVAIYLPRTGDSIPHPEAPQARAAVRDMGTGRILVVEDNDAVRQMTVAALERRGYQVTAVATGAEALAAVNGSPALFDLLLTDIILPDFNGRIVYERIAATGATLNVVYMSGYADDVLTERGVLGDGVSFLQKPFTPQQLAQKVQEALTRPR